MGPGEGLGEGVGRLGVSGGENLRLFLTMQVLVWEECGWHSLCHLWGPGW